MTRIEYLWKLLSKDGEILSKIEGECDNGHYEVLDIKYTNGVKFLVFKLNDEIIEIS